MVTRQITRRRFAVAAGTAALGVFGGAFRAGAVATLSGEFARIEHASGGRLGVAVVDTLTGEQAGHRADEFFAMCSTFKVLAAAAILARVDAGAERLERRVRFEAADVVAYSPATRDRTGAPGVPLADLCAAAMTLSDNTAANLLIAALGGPAAVTAFARGLGDAVTRLDRIEPELNEAAPGDSRDTTSPNAMASNLRKLVLGDSLSQASRERLAGWLYGNKTGDRRLRAGLPAAWRVGDKTGSGGRGTTADVAVAWPPDRAPVIVAAYLTGTSAPVEQREASLAAVARAVAVAVTR